MIKLKLLGILLLFLALSSCGNRVETTSLTVGTTIAPTTTESSTTTQDPNPYDTTTVPWPALGPVVPPTAPPTTTRVIAPTSTAKPYAAPTGSANTYLQCVANRESKGSYTVVNSSSGASGKYQFLDSSWNAMGFAKKYGTSKASYATPAQQEAAANEAYNRFGKQPWGSC